MRILHVTERWVTGVATMAGMLIHDQLSRSDIAEVHLVACTEKTPATLPFDDHAQFRRHSYQSSRSVTKIMQVCKEVSSIIHRVQPDVVILHSSFPGVYGRWLPLPSHTKVIYCPHGWAFAQEVPKLKKLLYAKIEAHLAKRTAAIVLLSLQEGRLAHQYGVRAKIERIINNSVRQPHISGNKPISPAEDIITVGYIGRFDRQKGIDVLKKAWDAKKRRDVRLVLIGGAARTDDTIATTAIPSGDDVMPLGWVAHPQIDDFISCFDVMVIPSRWEGFALAPLEAMRCGVPLIVSDVGGLGETVIHGATGYRFISEDADALAHIFDSLYKSTLRAMGERGRSCWEAYYTVDRCVGEWHQLVKDVQHLAV